MQILEHSIFGLRSARLSFSDESGRLSVTLFPMVHVGEAQFYRDVYEDAFQHDMALVEGVLSPAVKRLTRSYRWLDTEALGWIIQPKYPPSEDVRAEICNADIQSDEFERLWRRIPWKIRAVTVLGSAVLGIASRWILDSGMIARRLEMDELPQRSDILDWSPEYSVLGELVMDARDRCLTDILMKALERYSAQERSISIVYGAAHMPAVIRVLRANGFTQSSGTWMKIFST